MIQTYKLNIVCPICNKPDGCLIAQDGSACICSRIEKDSVKRVGKGPFRGGWLHILADDFKPMKYETPPKPDIDWNALTVKYAYAILEKNNLLALGEYAHELGLSPWIVSRFNVGYLDGWITIPMYDRPGHIVGIQKRQKGFKRYMEHSGIGVFVPLDFFDYKSKTVAIVEGWSDAVAAKMYGMNVLGKPNFACGNEELVPFITAIKPERALIFADDDRGNVNGNVGYGGAKETMFHLHSECKIRTKVQRLPRKDLRQCLNDGLTLKEIINAKEDNKS